MNIIHLYGEYLPKTKGLLILDVDRIYNNWFIHVHDNGCATTGYSNRECLLEIL